MNPALFARARARVQNLICIIARKGTGAIFYKGDF